MSEAGSTARDGRDRAGAAAPSSTWRPFRYSAFTVLWTATVVSNIGTWMHEVGAGWLMTSLAPSPFMVALVQGATTLPIFLLALPAGALADIVDRRKVLLAVTLFLTVVAAALGGLVWLGLVTPWVLLVFTFLMGAGAAFAAPAWQAIVPTLVPRADLQPAVALNSVGINISRAIGPALGGLIIATLGIAVPFLLNAVSSLGVIAALLWWKPPAAPARRLPAERFASAIRTGLRYARASGPLRATLGRAVAFFLFASAYWALLPLIARGLLGGGPELYGILLGCVGAGAVGGALFLPKLKALLGPDRLVAAGTLGMALVLIVLATIANDYAAAAVSLSGRRLLDRRPLEPQRLGAGGAAGMGAGQRALDLPDRLLWCHERRQRHLGTHGRGAWHSADIARRGGRGRSCDRAVVALEAR